VKTPWQRMAELARRDLRSLRASPFPGCTYAREFMKAFHRTQALGLSLPPVSLLVEKDCVDTEVITRAVHKYLDEYSDAEALGQAFAINVNIIPYLYAETGIPFTLTMGWFEHLGKELYRHDEQLLRTLLRSGIADYPPYGIPLHVWLTSPACEVLDVTLPSTIATVSGTEQLSGGIIYISNQDTAPPWIYHPTVVGVEFLEKIGAAMPLGGARH
jgi:hypothetical protein